MKTIGIIGTRRKDDKAYFLKTRKLFRTLYEKEDTICSGLCSKGGDWFAVLIALGYAWIETDAMRKDVYYSVKKNNFAESEYKIKPIWFPANWEKHGKSAGFVRNIDIAQTSDFLIAVVADDRKGGTEDTIKKFMSFHGKQNLFLIK